MFLQSLKLEKKMVFPYESCFHLATMMRFWVRLMCWLLFVCSLLAKLLLT